MKSVSVLGAKKQKGFTIVELLIVIVVIAILAVITIVTFNGIQDRARRASLAVELGNIAKILKNDQIMSGSYPATLAAANGGAGVKVSPGVTLQYSVDNSANPQTFLVSAVNGKNSFILTQDGAPRENAALGASSTNVLITDGATVSSSYYGTGAGLSSVTVTLPAAVTVSMVKVWHYYSDSRTYHATKTEVSADGTNWTTIFDSAVSGEYSETSAGRTTVFSPTSVKYIRDWLNGSTSNTSSHWVEIQAY